MNCVSPSRMFGKVISVSQRLSLMRAFSTLSGALPKIDTVKIVEVGPRDGLQNEIQMVSVENKIRLIKMLADAGCQFIEAGSFVSAKAVPSMANTSEVILGLSDWRQKNPKVTLCCLVPNVIGLGRAIERNVDEVAIFGSVSESFSQKNIGCSVDESMKRFKNVIAVARDVGVPVRGYLSCVMGCPYEGQMDPRHVVARAEEMLVMGCHEISLGDTIGVGTPASTLNLLEALTSVLGTSILSKLAVHFHDTYGQALANISVSLERGIRVIDSSVAGLGGCPYAKGATGNVATEDVIYMLNELGVDTGIDIEKLVDATIFISSVLERPSKSKTGTAIAAKRT